jgi:exodeoxyribonuclease VIII
MNDLETLGTRAGCVILSIGAQAFCPQTGELGDTFYIVISSTSCAYYGLTSEPLTLTWWLNQSEESRGVITQANSPDAINLKDALKQYNTWLKKQGGAVQVWGNGSDFDNAILYAAYAAVDVPVGFKFWNSRCYRTLCSLHQQVKLPARVGTHHNALDDATTQALGAIAIFNSFDGSCVGTSVSNRPLSKIGNTLLRCRQFINKLYNKK